MPKLIAAALIAKAPGRYGFAVPAPAPFAYDSLVVDDATGLDVVARLAGASVADLRELNPQYLRLVTPPRSAMVIRLPAGTGPAVAEGYAKLSPKSRVHYMTHVVGRREKLSTIAARYHLPMREIQVGQPEAQEHAAGQGHAPRHPHRRDPVRARDEGHRDRRRRSRPPRRHPAPRASR